MRRDLDLGADVLPRRREAAASPPSPARLPSPPAPPAAPPGEPRERCEPGPPPTLVCSGMFCADVDLGGTLSVARMCGVASTFGVAVRGERVEHDAERGDARAGAEQVARAVDLGAADAERQRPAQVRVRQDERSIAPA